MRLDFVSGSKPADIESLRRKLVAIPYVDLVKKDSFDCLIRGELKGGKYFLRLVTPMGDKEKLPPFRNLDDLIKVIKPYLEYTYLLKKLALINNPNPPFKVQVWMEEKDRRDYRVGEQARFSFSSDQDCYLIMLNLDSRGNMRILFPNQYFQDNFIKAGRTIKIPDEKMGKEFELEFGEPVGAEVVKVIATEKPLKLEDLGLFKADLGGFDPKGLISVPENLRSVLVKKVEKITAENIVWSEDTIVIRTHK